MISFEDFEKQFNNLVKDKKEEPPTDDPNFKPVDSHTFGDIAAGVRIAEILNEYGSSIYRKKSLRFLHLTNECYQEINRIKNPRIRKYFAGILHSERKKVLHETNLPPKLRNHMYNYIIAKYRNCLGRKKKRSKKT